MLAVEEFGTTLKSWTVGTDVEACQKRLEILADASTSVKEALSSNNGALAAALVEKVADSCRQHDNRALVLNGGFIPTLVSQFTDTSVMKFIVPVLYNVCVDYEPTQKAVAEAKFSTSVASVLSGPLATHAEPSLNLISKLLGILTTHDTETESAPTTLPPILLSLALRSDLMGDLDDFISVVSTALSYLAASRFHSSILETPNAMATLLSVFEAAYTKYEADTSDEESDEPEKLRQARWASFNAISDITALPEFAIKFPLQSAVCMTLKSWISPLRPTNLAAAACISLGNLARSDVTVAAMVAEENKMHEPLIALLSDKSITDSQLLHACLSFLKNLSIPPQNKELIGSSGLLAPEVLPRIWEYDVNPQVQFAAVSLTRLLLTGSLANFTRLYDLSKTESENANADGKTHIHRLVEVFKRSDTEPTKMEGARAVAAICRLLHTSGSTTAASNTKPENTPPISSAATATVSDSSRAAFYTAHSIISEPLAFLVGQSKFPVLRSEGWFIFALMCRTSDGAQIIQHVVQKDAAMDALSETITGIKKKKEVNEAKEIEEIEEATEVKEVDEAKETEDVKDAKTPDEEVSIAESTALVDGLSLQPQGPEAAQASQGAQPTAAIDRENALVMISELTKQASDDMPSSIKTTLVSLIKQGSDLLHKTE
ncbi:hypothetical protein HOO65_020665 [Ceratocystis lukuohia]|uniref:Uncharacterized protein n=1 Tax=Ceratocystis lukuohia TaxID=2019550 RepID=A0ABR4MPA8_9PEZI